MGWYLKAGVDDYINELKSIKEDCARSCEGYSECISWNFIHGENINSCVLFYTLCNGSDIDPRSSHSSFLASDIYECEYVGKIIYLQLPYFKALSMIGVKFYQLIYIFKMQNVHQMN